MNGCVTVQLRFFASLRERLGCAGQQVELPPEIKTIGQVRYWLMARGGVWAEALAPDRPVRAAYQQVMCDDAQVLDLRATHQEIAFFPPVTGG